jgi:serine/threonine protein kinase
MLYSHLAREPPRLAVQEPKYIFSCLSDIIFKMMAKSPDERYQSTEGFIKDLEHCKNCLEGQIHNQSHSTFVPGRYDVSGIFKLPSKLYGRDKETAKLLQYFNEANLHREVFLNGYSFSSFRVAEPC